MNLAQNGFKAGAGLNKVNFPEHKLKIKILVDNVAKRSF